MRHFLPTLTNFLVGSRRAALGALALIPFVVSGQEATQPFETLIVTATRVPTDAKSLPLNISKLDEETLQELEAVHIQQAIAQVPGVTTQRGNGQESLPGIRSAVLTGAGACGSVLILEDAIPVRGPAFCNVNELFDTHFEQADSIEVTRGPGTAFYGSNALTGMVNVNLSAYGPSYASIEAGSHGYFRAQGANAFGNTIAQRLMVSLTHDGGYRDNSGYEQAKLSWRLSGGDVSNGFEAGVSFTNLDQQTAGFIEGEDAYLDRGIAKQNFDPEGFRDTQSLRAWSRWIKQLSDSQSTEFAVYARATDMVFRMHFLPGEPLEENDQIGLGWQSSLSTKVSPSLLTVIGLDGDWSAGSLRQSQELATQGSDFLAATIPAGIHYDYQVDAAQLAVFGQLTWEPGEKWQVIAGLRGERLDYDYNNLSLDGRTKDDGTQCGFGGCRYSRPADRKDAFTDWSPKLQVKYTINDHWLWYATLSSSARAPQATELYRLQRDQEVANLDSVTANNVEFGVAYISRNLDVNVTGYHLALDNEIIRDADFFNIDGNRTDSSGVEVSAKWQLNPAWSLNVSGTYAEHKYASDQLLDGININNRFVDTAPKTAGSVWLRYKANDRLKLSAQVQHLGDYFLEPTNQFTYPGHNILNMYASYQLNDTWSLSARLLNFTDKKYAERADYTTFSYQRYFPSEPRSVFVSLRREM